MMKQQLKKYSDEKLMQILIDASFEDWDLSTYKNTNIIKVELINRWSKNGN